MTYNDQRDLEHGEESAEESPGLLRNREPYLALVAGILDQAVRDAKERRKPVKRSHEAGGAREEARTFLLDGERVAFFCALAGCDNVQPTLLKAAGLTGQGA